MKYKIFFILLFVWVKVSAQPTIQDTTRMLVFDPVKSWVTTGSLLKTYVIGSGSTAITTLGTVTTGTWNATPVGILYGGSGQTTANSALNAFLPSQSTHSGKFLQTDGTNTSWVTSSGSVATDAIWDAAGDIVQGTGANTAARLAIGTASQQLRVNAGATALEYFTPSAGSGDITNGGNTTGATVVIGTNDANALELETNGVSRLAITGGASTGGAATLTNVTANTNTVQDVLTVRANSTGTAAAGFGSGVLFQQESSTTNNRDAVKLGTPWTTATDGSQNADLEVYTSAGGALQLNAKFRGLFADLLIGSANQAAYKSTGITTAQGYTIGNSTSALTILSTGTSGSSGIILNASSDASTSSGNIVVGPSTSFTQTSGTRDYLRFRYGFAPTSGTAIHNKLTFDGTLNQTGGSSGIVRGINLAHTVTAVADYRAIEIADDGTNVKGLYQTGSTATNNLVGRTTFGATSAPNAAAAIDVVSTTSGVLFPRMTGTERDAISSPPNGLVLYNTTTDKLQVRAAGAWVDLH